MPSIQHHGASIYYEEFGQGFPILTFASAGRAQPIGRVGEMKPGRAARFDAWAKTLGDHPEVTESVLDAVYQNLYGPGFVYSVDRAFVSSCRTPCLVLAGNDEAHPFPI